MTNWKYGVSYAEVSPVTAPLPLAGDIYENLRKAASYGYNGIELHTLHTACFDYNKIREAGDECGCHICMVVTGRMCTQEGLSLLPEDDSSIELQKAYDAFSKYFEMAQNFGNVPIVLGWARGKIPSGVNHEDGMKKLGERIKKLDEMAVSAGIDINLEVINHYEINTFNTAAETMEFIDRNELRNCYVHLDVYHMALEENDPCAVIHKVGKRIGHFHVSDSTRQYVGSGQYNFPAIMKALNETGYDKNVVVECLPYPNREEAAVKSLTRLKEIEKEF